MEPKPVPVRARITIEYPDGVPDSTGAVRPHEPVVFEMSDISFCQSRKIYAEREWALGDGGQRLLVPDPVTEVTISGCTVPNPEKHAEFEKMRPYLVEVG